MDYIKLELFHHRFLSIAESMAATLRRTAFSRKLKEGGAYSCGLFNNKGDMISYVSPIPIHLSIGSLALESIEEQIPDMKPDDIYIVNNPFKGGTHLANITLIAPVFHKRSTAPDFFVITSAHHSEIGGASPGGILLSKSIIDEGLFIEPIKLSDGGKINQPFLDSLLSKVAYPKERYSDLFAQIYSVQTGIKRAHQLLKKHHIKTIRKYSDALLDYSERRMRETIKTIPDGTYSFTDYLDDDGLGNRKIKLRVAITIKDDQVDVDLSRCYEVVRGPLNAVYSVTYAAVFYVFRSLSPRDIPLNDGCMRSINVITKRHTIVNASYPSSVAGGATETAQRLVDLILGAMAEVLPKQVPAASQGTMNNITFTGFDTLKNQQFTFYETIPGGSGGAPNHQGVHAIQTHMMNMLTESVESIEYRYPVRVTKYLLRRHSCGQGQYSGGCGVVKHYQVRCDVNVTLITERRLRAPYGLNGGKSGKKGNNYIITRDKKEISLEGKCSIKLQKGDTLVIETPGGGGWGKLER